MLLLLHEPERCGRDADQKIHDHRKKLFQGFLSAVISFKLGRRWLREKNPCHKNLNRRWREFNSISLFYNFAFSKRIQKYQEIHSLNAKSFRLPLTYAFASVNMNSRNKFGFLSPRLLLLPAPITRTKRSRTSSCLHMCRVFSSSRSLFSN